MPKRIIAVLATWSSLAGLAWGFYKPNQILGWKEVMLICASIILLGYLLILEFREYQRTKKFPKGNKAAINKYMRKWISGGDSVAIFTRDMTWAHDSEIKDLLILKSSKNEPSLFLPKTIPLAKELKDKGANVFTYDALEVEPTSRFTVVNYGKGDAQVAIGRTLDGEHVIEEFSAGTHPVFHVAIDLINVLRRASEMRMA